MIELGAGLFEQRKGREDRRIDAGQIGRQRGPEAPELAAVACGGEADAGGIDHNVEPVACSGELVEQAV